MSTKIETFLKPFLKKDLPDIRPGDTVRVYQKIKERNKKVKSSSGKKEKTQVFEGLVLARKHGKEIGATITVRKVISGIGVERIFPIHSPVIKKIEIVKRGKVRRAKLYYLRKAKGKKARLKKKDLLKTTAETEKKEKIEETQKLKQKPVNTKIATEKQKK
jgi:large subunit ribosomal protein L19